MNDSDFWSESNVLGGTKFGLYSQINCNLKLVYLVSIFNGRDNTCNYNSLTCDVTENFKFII